MSLTEGRARGDVLEAVLYGLVTPIVLVTMCSDILFMNAAAERLILASDGLMADANGLRAVSAAETRLLRALISGVAQTPAAHGCDRSELFRVSRRYGRERLQVRVSPIPAQADGQPRRQLPIAAVFVIDPQSRPGLDERALIRGYRAELDAGQLGLKVHAFVQVSIDSARYADFETAAAGHPAVLQCYTTAGQADYLMHVLVSEIAELDQLLRMQISRMPGVQRIETTVCMKTIKPRAPLSGCLLR